MYQADPVYEDEGQKKTLPLELLCITFHAQYYATSQGTSRKCTACGYVLMCD